MCMYWFTEERVIASSPKVGTRTLTKMFGAPYTNLERVVEMFDRRPVYLFLRDPIDRLASYYAHMTKRRDILVNWPGLVNAVLTGYQDMHCQPQALLHTHEGRFLPTNLIRFEDFESTLSSWGHEVFHENCSVPVGDEDPSYRHDELSAHYAEDIELRTCLQMS